jgi:diacylglycerol kinase family enzyme
LRVVLVYNPRSGRGRALGAAQTFARALADRGHETSLVEADAEAGARSGRRDAGALVIVGGDGTLHHAVAALLDDDHAGPPPPLYHLPLGTQNLFARELGMTADPRRLDGLLAAGRPRTLDEGVSNARPFLHMCRVGPDAGVHARLHAGASEGGRRRPISHRSYIGPIARELVHLKMPVLSLSVDGIPVVDHKAGMAVIGNSRCYAMRFDPAARASMSDGLLDTVFYPARGRASIVGWGIASRLGCHTRVRSLLYRTGTRIEISSDGPTPYQLDGELFHAPQGRLCVSIRPGALRVWA